MKSPKIYLYSLAILTLLATQSTPSQAEQKAIGCEPFPYSSIVDNRVFNWLFYLNSNTDLNIGGFRTPTTACTHWVNNGFLEGRQAHPGFSSSQYLFNNPDIEKPTLQNRYHQAINHWISHGFNEGRVGYTDDGINKNFGRSTISNYDGSANYKIYISTSRRTAGAIDSLVVNNVEYVNSVDHGRQAQLALVATAHGQGWNPTEAGNCLDDRGDATSSILNSSNANGNTITTSNNPAFWEHPEDLTSPCVTGNGDYYTPAVNTTVVASDIDFNKVVKIGTQVNEKYYTNIIDFSSRILLRADIPGNYTTIAAPSMNLSIDFNTASIYNPTENKIFHNVYYGGHQSGKISGSIDISPDSYTEISHFNCFAGYSQCQSNSLPIVLSIGALKSAAHAIASCTKSYTGPGDNFGNVITTATTGGGPLNLDPTTGLNMVFNIKSNFTKPNVIPLQTYIVVAQSTPQSSAASQISEALKALYSSGLCNLNTATPFSQRTI